ncbi:MAG TPA: nitroreductase [Mycobacteriales bacterium]|nr:nitroreductase [Mycobacteriales bacterium]
MTTIDIPAALATILSRQSVAKLTEPGPTDEQLALILEAATTVPDHGQLRPWRLVVVRDDARNAFGDALAAAGQDALGDELGARASKLRGKAFIAPALVVLVASPVDDPKVPVWEQVSSASCTGYAIALAAHALGLGAVWKTAPYLDGTLMRSALGLRDGEQVLGWVNLGTPARESEAPHARPDLTTVVTELDPVARTPVQWAP